MATGKIKAPIKLSFNSIQSAELMYNPNYGEIVGITAYTANNKFDIYFIKDRQKIEFYKDGTLIWSK